MVRVLKVIPVVASSKNLWTFAALYAGFWLLTPLVTYTYLNLITQCFMATGALAVMWVYRKPGWASLITHKVTREDHLVLGICVAWMGVFLRSATILAWRSGIWGNDPLTPLDTHWVNSFNFMILLGAVLHITAPGPSSAPIPRPTVWVIVAAVLGASLLSFVMIWMRAFPLFP